VAAEADHLVAGQRLAERWQLAEQRLLDAQQCGLLLLEQLDQVRPTVGPVVGIARRVVSEPSKRRLNVITCRWSGDAAPIRGRRAVDGDIDGSPGDRLRCWPSSLERGAASARGLLTDHRPRAALMPSPAGAAPRRRAHAARTRWSTSPCTRR